MKQDIINQIKKVFIENGTDSVGFFYGRSFTITADYCTIDVMVVSYDQDEDRVIVTGANRNNWGLAELDLNDRSVLTAKKVLNEVKLAFDA